MADQLPDATKGVANYIDSYLDVLKSLLDSLDTRVLENVTELLFATWKEDRRLILCGNGGSGSTSSHLVCDFQKNIYLDGGKPFEVVALTDSPALLLAWANDTSFENVFAGQARTWVRKNDVLIAISGSGDSRNVLEAVKVANDVGATTIGFCGYDGGQLAEMVTIPIVAERRNMQQVEDVHMILGHILFSALRDKITGYLPSAS